MILAAIRYVIANVSPLLTIIFILYLFLTNSIYLFLLVAAIFSLSKQKKLAPLANGLNKGLSSFAPSISILAPAYNEQETVIESIKSFLLLEYPSYEVIVINDGSTDATFARLFKEFDLKPIQRTREQGLSTTEIRGTFQSGIYENLVVIDKVNGGKADALNVGIEYCRHDIFCAVDSDSLLEKDALVKVALPFMENPEETIASGGTVRIVNGSKVRYGRVESMSLPMNYWVLMQIIEYTRAFLCGRIGWNALNSTLVISGAFGLFSKSAVRRVGGYKSGSIGEDMELVVRMHHYHRRHKIPYSVVFVADPVCWTEAPSDMYSLGQQRNRWQRGLAEAVMRNRGMIFNPRYGVLGLVAMPYFVFVELLGPVFELSSMFFIVLAFVAGDLDANLFYTFLLASVFYGAIMSVTALVVEEAYFSKYGRMYQFCILFLMGMIESFGYRQLTLVWRFSGMYKFLRGDLTWGHLKREGFRK